MMVSRQVFVDMQVAFPERAHIEGHVNDCFSWFDPRVQEVDGASIYMSEDYAMCYDWRGLGGKILLDPSIRLGHIGSFRYG